MKKFGILRQLLIIVILVLTIQNAHAALIIDTGTGSDSQLYLGPSQLLAGKFTLYQDYQITGVQGLIHIYTTGAVNYKIYKDDNAIDILPGNQIYSTPYTIPAASDNWYGPSGLTWGLSAGTYWIALEPDSGDFGMPTSPPNPLSNYAYFTSANKEWMPGGTFSVRIYGESSAVPIPGAIWLLGSGLIGLIGIRRLRK
jgi:hypothetical protein